MRNLNEFAPEGVTVSIFPRLFVHTNILAKIAQSKSVVNAYMFRNVKAQEGLSHKKNDFRSLIK